MKKIALLFTSVMILFCWSNTVYGQRKSKTKIYSTTGGELIFSWADMQVEGVEGPSVLRFSPVFNYQSTLNVDPSRNFGMYTGISFRNVGFIYDSPTEPGTRYKHRTYNFAIPIGMKIGRLDKTFIYFGYDFEVPFHYKEKKFVNEDKVEKTTVWFSDRVESIAHSFFVGIQLPYGTNIKFKYYTTNFFNTDYVAFDENGMQFQPYEGFDNNIFYISLNFNLFHNVKFFYSKGRPEYDDDGYNL